MYRILSAFILFFSLLLLIYPHESFSANRCGSTARQEPTFTESISSINDGQTITGALSSASSADVYTFEGRAGQRILTISLNRTTSWDPVLHLHDPSGNLVACDDDSGADGRSSLIQNVLLTSSGTYRIEAKSYGSSTGSYQLFFDISDGGGTTTVPPEEGVVFDSDRHFVNLPQLNSQGHQTLITLFKFTVKVSNNLIQVTFKDKNQTHRIVGLISISIALPETIHVDYQNIQIMADGQSANPPERISLLEFIFELVLGEIPGLDSLLAASNLSNNLNEIEEGEILRNTLFDTAARNTHDVVIQRFHSPAIPLGGANEIILRVPVIGSTSEIINKLRNDGGAAFFFSGYSPHHFSVNH